MTLLITLFSLISFITGADSIGSAPKAELLFVGDAMQHQRNLTVQSNSGLMAHTIIPTVSL